MSRKSESMSCFPDGSDRRHSPAATPCVHRKHPRDTRPDGTGHARAPARAGLFTVGSDCRRSEATVLHDHPLDQSLISTRSANEEVLGPRSQVTSGGSGKKKAINY